MSSEAKYISWDSPFKSPNLNINWSQMCRRKRSVQRAPRRDLRHSGCARRGRRYRNTHLPVLRIQDILVWIRIRRSMPLTYGSESGFWSCYFCHWPSRRGRQQKKKLKKKFSCLLLFVRHVLKQICSLFTKHHFGLPCRCSWILGYRKGGNTIT